MIYTTIKRINFRLLFVFYRLVVTKCKAAYRSRDELIIEEKRESTIMRSTKAYGCYCSLVLAVIIMLEVNPTNAATITVTTAFDFNSPADCSLREAITSINTASLQDGCTISEGSFGNADLIVFGFAPPFTITLENGPLMVTEDMNISSGAQGLVGAELAIIRAPLGALHRIFHIDGVRINILNFTISNGFVEHDDYPVGQQLGGGIYATNGAELRVSNSIVTNNRADIGGGIGLDMGSSLTLRNSRVSNNTAIAGAGIGGIDNANIFVRDDSVIEDNHANEIGGGIGLRSSSSLRIRSSIVRNNRAFADPDDYVGMGLVSPEITQGGGISASDNSDVEVIENSVVSGNIALNGGGVHISNSELEVSDSVVENNVSEGIDTVFLETVTERRGFGGGIYADSGSINVQNSEVRTNSAGSGGGVFITSTVDSTSVSINQSTVVENVAQNWGGGLYITAAESSAFVINSTLSSNIAGDGAQVGVFPAGGGIYALSAETRVFSSTLALNTVQNGTGGGFHIINGFAGLANNIVSGNNASFSSEFSVTGGDLSVVTEGNLVGDASKTFAQSIGLSGFVTFPNSNDIVASSTLLSGEDNPGSTVLSDIILPLSNNGGSTRTHNLPTNSPALDAGVPSVCSVTVINDQRGQPRNDGRCDIGSVEIDQTACYVITAQNGNVITFCL